MMKLFRKKYQNNFADYTKSLFDSASKSKNAIVLKYLKNVLSRTGDSLNFETMSDAANVCEKYKNSKIIQINAGLSDQVKNFLYIINYRKLYGKKTPIYIDMRAYLGNGGAGGVINASDIMPLHIQNLLCNFELFNYKFADYARENNIHFINLSSAAAMLFALENGYSFAKWYNFGDACKDNSYEIDPLLQYGSVPKKAEIMKWFDFIGETNPANIEKLQLIKSAENPICMHIRRGEQISAMNGKTVSPSYFHNALKKIIAGRNLCKATVFIFSEELEWVRKNVDFNVAGCDISIDFVNINDGAHAPREIELMRNCDHYVKSIGGFCDLAVFLNPGDPIVVSPSESDFYVEDPDIIKKSFSEKMSGKVF